MKKIIVIFLLLIIASNSQAQKYRNILPPRPPFPPALNNTVQSQIANQNINFNTSSNINGIGGGGIGGFNANSGGIQGTTQYTQNNTPGSQLSFLYQLPSATQFQQGGGGFGQGGGGFGQGGGGFGQGGGGNMGGQFGGGNIGGLFGGFGGGFNNGDNGL